MLSNPQSLKRKGDAGASASQVCDRIAPISTPMPSARSPDRQGGVGGKSAARMLLLVPPAPGIVFLFFWVLVWGFWYCFDPKCREMPGWYKMGVYRFGTVWRLGFGGMGCGTVLVG